jgi:TRAP-type mannitol/chloroaromatic compound transport system permease large subunit
MEWWAVLMFFIAGLILLLLSGFPIAFAFLFMDLLGIIFFMGPLGLKQIPLHVLSSISTFVLAPIPMFIFMGELMFHSGIAYNTIDVIDRWLARLPGRLGLLAAASGTLFAATSGSTIANTAMLGTVHGRWTDCGRGRIGHADPPVSPGGGSGQHRSNLGQ